MAVKKPQRTEVIHEVVFLAELVESVAAGKIRVPRFQRALLWKQSDMLALLDSVAKGFPIGSILVWETEQEITTADAVGPVTVGPRPDGLVGCLLDGQQRLSTLVGTLQLPSEERFACDVDWAIYYDLDEGEFQTESSGGLEPQHFPVRSLLSTPGFLAACRTIQAKVPDNRRAERLLAEADRLASAFRDYQLPLIHFREADLDSAVTVFTRLNRKDQKITADEMVSALTYREGESHPAIDELGL